MTLPFWRDVDFRRSKLAVCTLCRVLYGTDYDCAFPNNVHFMKRSHRSESGFVDSLPSDQQTDDVDDKDIVINLPDPVVCRGIFTFNYDFASYKVE